jgi:hypothetical protein
MQYQPKRSRKQWSESGTRWNARVLLPNSKMPDVTCTVQRGRTLADLSRQLEALPTIPTAARLPAVSPL